MLTRNGEKSMQRGKTEDEQERIKLSWDEVCPSLVQDVCQWQLNSIFLICVIADISPGRHCEEARLLE